jgi:hypothetical protein
VKMKKYSSSRQLSAAEARLNPNGTEIRIYA